jgi:hypothetical protein
MEQMKTEAADHPHPPPLSSSIHPSCPKPEGFNIAIILFEGVVLIRSGVLLITRFAHGKRPRAAAEKKSVCEIKTSHLHE